MFKFIFSLLALMIALLGGYWLYIHYDELSMYAQTMRGESKILTFESTISPDEFLLSKQKELLPSPSYSFGKITTLYLPYLLLDIKYVGDNKVTEEGEALFSLDNGEMVLDTRNFETTHGFEDCINANATADDFRLLQLIQRHGGSMQREALAHQLGIDNDALSSKINNLRKKQLIAIKGDTVRIHFAKPLLLSLPTSKVMHRLVTKEVPSEVQLPARYSSSSIKKMATAAFGQDFAIRREQALFIPILEIEVQNPDGTVLKTHWSGITGKPVTLRPT